MIKLKNKFAIGCLIQWYEIELIPLYLESVKEAINHIDNKENVVFDFSSMLNAKSASNIFNG